MNVEGVDGSTFQRGLDKVQFPAGKSNGTLFKQVNSFLPSREPADGNSRICSISSISSV